MEDGSYQQDKGRFTMTENSPDTSPLPHQKKAWSQRELLASILNNHLHVHASDGGRWPSWVVSTSSDSIHDDVVSLNRHLERLGWMGKLTQHEEGWKFTVFPRPERQFPRFNTLVVFWSLSLLTLTLAGNHWMSPSRPENGWLHPSSLVDSMLGYALPVLSVLFFASVVQRKVCARYGVRSGHLLPVPDFTIALYALGLFPSSWLFWPFGLLLIPTLPRMDARPWPDRAALGFSALTVPVVFGVAGVGLFLAGLTNTPEYLVSSSMPFITDPPVFLSLLALDIAGEDAWVRLIWAHPWVHAGGMLMLFAWISILPIPTLPGGRLLIARMGLLEARSSSTQSLIVITMLFCAYVFGVFSSFSLWYLVFALLLPLLFFFGTDLRIPMLLNETTGLSERDHRRMGTVLLLLFVFLLPAAQPVVHDEDWDAAMTFALVEPEVAVLLANGSWHSSTKLIFTNPSSLQKPYAVKAVFASEHHDWSIQWDCDGEDALRLDGQGCGSHLLPQRTASFWMNLTWTGAFAPTSAEGSYLVDINGEYEAVPFTVQPALEVVPSERWYDELEGATARRCIDLSGRLVSSSWLDIEVFGQEIDGLQTPLVTLDEGTGLTDNRTEVPERVCLSGVDPLVFQSAMAGLRLNNDTFAPLLPERRPLIGFVPSDGWTVTADGGPPWGALFEDGGILQGNGESCPINASISTPPRPMDGDWVWDTSLRASGSIPLVESGQNLTLLLEEGDNVSICNDAFSPYPKTRFVVVEGPELLVQWMGTLTRFWSTPWAVASNGTLLNTGMGELSFTNPGTEPVPFRLAREGSLGEDWQHNWDGLALSPGTTNLTFVPPSTPLSTMWVTYESGSVVVHLASYA